MSKINKPFELGKPLLCAILAMSASNTIMKAAVLNGQPSERMRQLQTAEKRTVTGRVTDDKKHPVIGASVYIQGNRKSGTITNDTGEFFLKTMPEDTLVISYLGFEQQYVPVNNQTQINVILNESKKALDEVVVVGYGTQKKVNLTGAITQITSKELEDKPVANATQMLQGIIPNVNITFSTARPGAGGTVNIRGLGSINSNAPLILVDGVPGDLNRLNPDAIESISVLKDAAASAIYGARGAFGVVLVTTKEAKSGKMSISYSNNFSFSSPTVRTDFMTSGYETLKLVDEAFQRNTGNTYSRYSEEDYEELKARQYDKVENPARPWVVVKNVNGKDIYNYYGNWDWWHFLFKDNQHGQSHNLNLSGGNDKLNFMVSGRYYQQDGVMKVNTDNFNSYTFLSKINAQLFPFLRAYNNISYYTESYSYTGIEGGINQNFMKITQNSLPAFAPYNPDGSLTLNTNKNTYMIGGGVSPMLLDGKNRGANSLHEVKATFGMVLDITKSIQLNADYTYDLYITNDWYRSAIVKYSIQPGVLIDVPAYNTDQLKRTMWLDPMHTFNLYLNYNQQLKEHEIGVTTGINYETKKHARLYASRKNLISETLNDLNLGTGDMEVGGGQYQYVLFGAFIRANYNYAQRYLLEFDGRYDGTSRYKEGRRYGFFPSASAAWRISEEKFFSNFKPIVDNLKLRFSYGSLGNQLMGNSSVSSNYYPYISMMPMGLSSWLINGSKTQYVKSSAPIISNLTWERATTTNFGIDANFFSGRLTLSADYYIRKTTDMLIPGETLPAVFGASSPKQNAGDMRTNGYEISLSWNDRIELLGKDLRYTIYVGLGDATSVITKFSSESSQANSQYDVNLARITDYYVGKRIGEIWGYKIDGFFKSDEEAANWKIDQTLVNSDIKASPGEWGHLRAGDLKYKDLNGDGKISPGTNTVGNHGDLVVIGNSEPRYNYNFGANMMWNGIDISAMFQGIGRRDWYPNNEADKFWAAYSRPYYGFIPKDFEGKIWSEQNPNSYFPVLRGYAALGANASLGTKNDRYIQNIGYLRLKNIVIGYTVPKNLTKKFFVQKLRFYFSGENLLTWTPLETEYIDPEQPVADINGRSYPLSKTVSFGIDITF